MKAEAKRIRSNSCCNPLLNQIRTRAELGNTAAVSKAEVRTAIWKVEMAFEHDRFTI
jgi:hypothetical protein